MEKTTPLSVSPIVIFSKTINQTQLGEMLKLPPNVVKYLKDENIISWKKDGKQTLFDETSIKEFQKTFNRDDYLTKRECSKKLNRWEFTSFRDSRKNIYFHPLRIYINTKTLINGSFDIPKEYQLKIKKFGDTKYVLRTSFAKTLNWLRKIKNNLHPKLTQEQSERIYQLCLDRKEKIKNHNNGKKIKLNFIQMAQRFGSHNFKIGKKI